MTNTLPYFIRKAGEKYILSQDNIVYIVNSAIGGRIESLQFNGAETLLTPESGSDNLNEWGNVFWPSPQSDWGWPPSPTLDYKPYTVEANDNFLILSSEVDKASGFRFEKYYGFSETKNRVRMRYRIYNHAGTIKKVAPWEITRFPPAGRVFFPKGKGEAVIGDFDPLPTITENGITWFNYNHNEIGPRDHKLMIDGSGGWLAHCNKDVLFVKHFNDITLSQAAPNEGEIEIYAKGVGTYIEVEQQGAHTSLSPGEFLEWQVEWSLAACEECGEFDDSKQKAVLLKLVKAQLGE